jgi:DNA-binding SARP family transcriptional activator/Flp pilus assembly protein TadD
MSESSTRAPSVSQPSSPRFELRCWGEFRLFDRVQRAECTPQRRKARALVAYLAAHGGTPISRERLATLLWSERGDQQARASLRQTLFELRTYATDATRLLVIDHDQVQLNALSLTSDIARMEALAGCNDLDTLSQALADSGDRLYEGLDGLDPAFDEWLALERRRRQEHVLSFGVAAAARGLQTGAHEAVSRLATALQAFDEANEAVAQIGMKADHARGDCSAVRRRYQRLCEVLKQDLGVAPSRETETLLGDLTRPQRPSSPGTEPALVTQAAQTPAGGTPPSIGVLPSINRSGREEDDVFAEGMVEDLTAALSVNPLSQVVAASATAIYRKGARDLRQIGRDLGVRYLLEGNVRRVGEDLRVTAQLVEAETCDLIWTQKFDRPLAELAKLQDDLVADVAAHLGVQVLRAEMDHAGRTPEENSVWDALRRQNTYSSRATRSGWEGAVAETKRAVEIDPNDAVALAVLAGAQGALLASRGGADPQLAQEIVDNIRQARALDPDNPTVLWCIAAALSCLGELQGALALAERAVAISPSLAFPHRVLGGILVRLGRSDEALSELDATERLEPNSPWLYYSLNERSVAHLQAGRVDAALAAVERALCLRPADFAFIQKTLCLAKLDRRSDARSTLYRLRDADVEITCTHIEYFVRGFYGGSKDVDEYVEIVRRIWDETADGPCA